MNPITIATTDEEIGRCFSVMRELRPHLREDDFVDRIRRQERHGYRLAYLVVDDRVRAVAGFRISESLAWGSALYVDDLVTAEEDRSHGHGAALFDWLVAHARANACDQLHLDSGVHRFGAHRFYLRQRMDITSHHFALKIDRS